MRSRTSLIDDHHVAMIHPGPGPDFVFPATPRETDAERLARYEAELLAYALERALSYADGELLGLAANIVALRATITPAAPVVFDLFEAQK